jgi:putative addiction module component (TIGR02574 family)
MTVEVRRVLHAALQLPADEREELIDLLEESLLDGSAEGETEAAWIDEAKRRLADIDSGKTIPVPSESMFERMDEVIERARARRTG